MSPQSILVCTEILCEVTNTNTTELSIIGVQGDREAERERQREQGRAGAAMATMAAMISMIRVPCSTPRPSSAVAATESSRFCVVSALAQRAGTRTGASRNWLYMNKLPHFWWEKTQQEDEEVRVKVESASASAFGADPWGLCGSRLPPLLLRKSSKPSLLLCRAAAADAGGAEGEDKAEVVAASGSGVEKAKGFSERFPALITGFFFFMWYFLNVIFNILNKKIYNYFPYPYFVSVIHLAVGVLYCLVSWSVGLPKRAPISKELFLLLLPVSFCHSLGHVMTNVSFATVAVSFTHTIKALEPFFNAAASQFVLGQTISLPLWLSLAPVVIGVSMASLTELSFNWTGFISAMVSNIAFTYRSLYSKKAMTDMDSTNVYAYISIISLFMCLPPAIIIEGPKLLQNGFTDAIAKVGMNKFLSDLFWVGMFYHLYNQLATNTLERVAPLTHAVGNVLKRVFVIGFSIVVFGNKISTQTAIGTTIAIAGVAVYSFIKAKIEEEKLKAKSA